VFLFQSIVIIAQEHIKSESFFFFFRLVHWILLVEGHRYAGGNCSRLVPLSLFSVFFKVMPTPVEWAV